MIRCVAKTITTVVLVTMLNACQTVPDPLVLEPVSVQTNNLPSIQQLTVTDQRSHAYLYRALKSEHQAEFAPLMNPLNHTIEQSLQPLVSNQPGQPLTWQVSIDEAIVTAELSTFNYALTHQVVLRVEAQQGSKTYSNTYQGQLTSEGVANPDAAVIERQFSQLLQSVLARITADPKLRFQ